MNKVFVRLQSWPVPMAVLLSSVMLLGSTVDEIDVPDWLTGAVTSLWSEREALPEATGVPDAPEQPDGPEVPDVGVPVVPFAPSPGRDDRTPVAFLNQVFDLGNPSLPEQPSGVGPVFWDHSGHGTGALISRTVVLKTAHLFAEAGESEGPYGRTPRPIPPSDERIYLESCSRAYDFTALDIGSMAPRERLGLDYAIAELAEPACAEAHFLPVSLTPGDLVGAVDQVILNMGAYRFADVDFYAAHPRLRAPPILIGK